MSSPDQLLEISDLIVDFDLESLSRVPVKKEQVLARLHEVGDRSAMRVVERLPSRAGQLDNDYVDALLIRVHCEMQRLSEEFQHGRRVLELLTPLLRAIAVRHGSRPFRIVDIGCGTGYVMRWLAAHAEFEQEVELVGVDFNAALIGEAKRLATSEQLACRFEVANAFQLENPATVYLSTGVLHHFRGAGLADFFRQHDRPAAQAFAHFDFQPTVFAWPGAWLFHWIRMREPLSRHDGVVSARRAHTAQTLLAATSGTDFRSAMYSQWIGNTRLPRVFHTVVGLRDTHVEDFVRQLGPRSSRLGGLQ